MKSELNEEAMRAASRSSCVRFSEAEFLRLKRDALTSGRSIPWLLKTAYFNRGISPPTLDVESRRSVLRELAYAGNNLNQLARNVNSGLVSNVKSEVQEILGTFRMLKSFLGLDYGARPGGHHGDRKDSL